MSIVILHAMGPLNELFLNIAQTIEGEFVLPERDFYRETIGYVALRKCPAMLFQFNADIVYPKNDAVVFERVKRTAEGDLIPPTSINAMVAHSLRYKPITDAVERRYALPNGLMTALIMHESSGIDLIPHTARIGEFGLIGITQSLAEEFGLVVSGDSTVIVDRQYSAELSFLMKREGATSEGRAFLHEHDERLNALANIDAVGRMLASWACDPAAGTRQSRNNLFLACLSKLPGSFNDATYGENIVSYMKAINDSEYIQEIALEFAHINASRLMPDGSPITMEAWLQEHHEYYKAAYPISEYEKLPLVTTRATDDFLRACRAV